jgi:hypothetical protein
MTASMSKNEGFSDKKRNAQKLRLAHLIILSKNERMEYGYARFYPTDDKKAELRTADLKKTGCRYVFTDSASSGRQAA